MRLKTDTSGNLAIYDETANGNAPLTAPTSNLGALQFHSALLYPKLVKVSGSFSTAGTLNGGTGLPAVSVNTWTNVAYSLFAHGQTGIPLVFGKLTISGVDVPLVGATPIKLIDANTEDPLTLPNGRRGFGRWAHLGADGTNVNIKVYSVAGFRVGLPAMTGITYTIWVTNLRLDGAQPSASDSLLLRMQSDRLTASAGKFDTSNRYMRKANSGTQVQMVKGKSIDAVVNTAVTPPFSMRFAVGSFVQQFGPTPTTGTQPGSFAATTVNAKFY